ncbi:MAG: ABC transporter ATP-binding protein [Hydrogenophaga sp.]|uniref:ABC transporter ATP-binding protein n=2 Tax=Hydrogenophaga sp. TaxID=1904254 RepID=UPI002609F64D|nr:ABC transporter ATP-binding protein [Hydrogenophaga sp.]MDD3786870.1 ABC transporter ATP-binding protein [Hydrogenophaga sp.]
MKPTDNRTGTAVTVEHLCRRFGEQHALRDVSLALAPGRVLALLGPSGCGKTTLLKLLAGLDRPGSGRILFGDNVVASETTMVPPQHRRLGMVFQDYALWPHMSVQANVAFPLEMQRLSAAEVRRRTTDALVRVGLGAMAQRAPAQLSGGQQQRVALARAIVAQPALLLFDEPLSNLDRDLRESLCSDMAQLLRQLGTTAVYVTHDHEEACTIADEVAVMSRGGLLQQAAPATLWNAPASPEVARFLKLGALTPARRKAGGGIHLSGSDTVLPEELLAPASAAAPRAGEGQLLIPGSAATPGALDGAALRATVAAQHYRSGSFATDLALPGGALLRTVTRERLAPDSAVGLHIAPRQLHWFATAAA